MPISTKMIEDLVSAAAKYQRDQGGGDIMILKDPRGQFVVLIGTTRSASEQIIEAYESLPGPITHDGRTD